TTRRIMSLRSTRDRSSAPPTDARLVIAAALRPGSGPSGEASDGWRTAPSRWRDIRAPPHGATRAPAMPRGPGKHAENADQRETKVPGVDALGRLHAVLPPRIEPAPARICKPKPRSWDI